MKKMLNEGNRIHNFISNSGSGTIINSGSGSGSTSQKVTVPTVPVPVPQRCLAVRYDNPILLGYSRLLKHSSTACGENRIGKTVLQ
jgi:hypothetical protein